jgi:formate--tetrahydrofolate ligase
VADVVDNNPSGPLNYAYDLTDSIDTKIEKVVKRVYGGSGIKLSGTAQTKLKKFEELGWSNLPICIAKTQYSFSDDISMGPLAKDFTLRVEDLVINAGAGFVVAIAGDIMRMPGLPKEPQALHIKLVNGEIDGLS